MLNANDYSMLRSQLSLMGCDYDDLPLASSYYMICQYLHNCAASEFAEKLASCEADVFCENLRLTREFMTQIAELADFTQILSKLNLLENPVGYYNFLWPYLVHDQSVFSQLGDDDPLGQAVALHVILLIALHYDESSIPNELEFEDISPWYDAICSFFPAFPSLEELTSCFEQLWRGCFLSEMGVPRIKNRRAIEAYLKYCGEKAISPETYLAEYGKIRSESDQFRNFTDHLNAARKDKYFETYEEDLIRILVGLRSEPPSFLLYYLRHLDSKGQVLDDFEFESSFFAKELSSLQESSRSLLVLCPSLSFVHVFLKKRGKATFLMDNELACSLLNFEFPHACFLTPKQLIENPRSFDAVAVFNHRAHGLSFDGVYGMIEDNSPILALVPQTHFTHKQYVRILYEHNIHINRIIAVPQSLTRTAPKKKAMVYARKRADGAIPPSVQLFFAQAFPGKLIYISKNEITFDAAVLFQGRTLIQLQNELSSDTYSGSGKTDSITSVHHFSKEIRIHYTLMPNRNHKFSAQVCYRAILNKDGKKAVRGTALTTRTEKGFRFHTKAEVLSAIEVYPLRPEVYQQIVMDLWRTRQVCKEPYTLKTVWYCCLGYLQQSLTYRHSVAVSLFCSPGNETISEMIPDQCTEDMFQDALRDCTRTQLAQINLILMTAERYHLIHANPQRYVRAIIDNAENAALGKVLHTLGKAAFTWEEEARIMNYLTQMHEEIKLPRCVVSSQHLAVVMRMFTGMGVREITALQWKHIVKNADHDFWQILVMQHLNDEGIPISNAHYSGRRSHRKIPCSELLRQLLAMRLTYLQETFGYSAEDVKEHPVILREEYPVSGRKGFAPRFCGRKKLSMLCRQALSEARIPPNIVNLVDKDAFFEADLNESLGDIFKSNFRTRANHTCALTAGELCYITGTKSKRTYDEYYADYSSSLSQESIRFALDEWTDRYLPMIHGDARKIRGLTLLVDAKDEDIYLKLSNLFGMRIDEMCSAR